MRLKVGSCEWSHSMRGSQPKRKSFSGWAASPYHALSRLTMYWRKWRPVAGGLALVRDVRIQRVMNSVGRGLGQIAGQEVVQGRDVGRALDAGMAPHGQDAAARPADIAEQELHDAPGADHLGAGGMLCPAQGVDQHARPLATGVCAEELGNARQLLRRASAHLRDHLRGISREVAFQDLEDATGMLQGRVAYRLAIEVGRHLRSRGGCGSGPAVDGIAVDPLLLLSPVSPDDPAGPARPSSSRAVRAGVVAERALVAPVSAHHIIDAGLRVEAAEQAVQVLGVLEALLDQGRRIGVMQDVFLEPAVMSQ